MSKILKDNSPIYIFCNCDRIDFFKQEFERHFTLKNIIVWDKMSWTAGDLDAQYGKQYEFILYGNKGRAPFNEGTYRYSDVWRIPRCVDNEQIHQNQKPLDVICRIINQHTKQNDIVFDGFMGSFTTAVACHKLNRHFIGAELDEEYYKLGQERLEKEMNQISLFDF